MQKSTVKYILKLTVIVLCLSILWVVIHSLLKQQGKNYRINEGWTVTVNDKTTENVNLEEFFFPAAQSGDEFVLSRTINEELTQPLLQVRVYHAVIAIFLDTEELFSYGDSYNEEGRMVGSGYFWVPLQPEAKDKTLTILCRVTEKNAFTSFETIYLGEAEDIILYFFHERLPELMVASFLLLIALYGFIFTLFRKKKRREEKMLMSLSGVAAVVALMITGSTGLLQILSQNYYVHSLIEFSSLFIAPIPVLLFVFNLVTQNKNKKIIGVCLTGTAVFSLVTMVASYIGLYSFQSVLTIYQGIIVIDFLIVVICAFLEANRSKSKAELTFLIGTVLSVTLTILDIIRFNVEKYIRAGETTKTEVVALAALVAVSTMIISYIQRAVETYHLDMEKQILYRMAYTDTLTGLNNRAYISEQLEKWDEDRTIYTLIYMDLNDFKEINDRFGHAVGDDALQQFAGILKDVFDKNHLYGRIAGDEFVAAVTENSAETPEQKIKELYSKTGEFNKNSEKKYQLDFAAGYVSKSEFSELSGWELCSRADGRMYENKKKMKEAGKR